MRLYGEGVSGIAAGARGSGTGAARGGATGTSGGGGVSAPVCVCRSASVVRLCSRGLVSSRAFRTLGYTGACAVNTVLETASGLEGFRTFEGVMFFSRRSGSRLVRLFVGGDGLRVSLCGGSAVSTPGLRDGGTTRRGLAGKRTRRGRRRRVGRRGGRTVRSDLPMLPMGRVAGTRSAADRRADGGGARRFRLRSRPLSTRVGITASGVRRRGSVSSVARRTGPVRCVRVGRKGRAYVRRSVRSLRCRRLITLRGTTGARRSNSGRRSRGGRFRKVRSRALRSGSRVMRGKNAVASCRRRLASRGSSRGLTGRATDVACACSTNGRPIFSGVLGAENLSEPLGPV